MAKKVWTNRHARQFDEMFESKQFSTREMAAKLGVTQRTIYNRLEALNLRPTDLPRRHRAPKKFEFSEAEKRTIVRLAQEGEKVTQILVKLNQEHGLNRTLEPLRRTFRELGLESSPFKPVKIGAKFGYLEVVRLANPRKNKNGSQGSQCVVRCHCGEEKTVSNFNLRTGNTKSCGCKLHLHNPDTPYIRIFHAYCFGAKSRKFEMKLSIRQIRHIVHMQCFYCHGDLSNYDKASKFRYMGIDRVDSAMHYTPGNVLPACKMCNFAKSNASLANFVTWLRRLGSGLNEIEILHEAARLGDELENLT